MFFKFCVLETMLQLLQSVTQVKREGQRFWLICLTPVIKQNLKLEVAYQGNSTGFNEPTLNFAYWIRAEQGSLEDLLKWDFSHLATAKGQYFLIFYLYHLWNQKRTLF